MLLKWSYLLSVFVLQVTAPNPGPSGDHVCIKYEQYPQTIRVSEQKPVTVREYTWCFRFPPRCSKYKVKVQTVYKTETVLRNRPVPGCCQGYGLDRSKRNCVAVCSTGCLHGRCVQPETCECEVGYTGRSCNTTCSLGSWGENCQKRCQCKNGGRCHPVTGLCDCPPGWIGASCGVRCPNNTYGKNCTRNCRCQNGGSCNHVTGHCTCPTGWKGLTCSESCGEGTKGDYCDGNCVCNRFSSCNLEAKKCECKPGLHGDQCDVPCPQGRYGLECEGICDECNIDHGKCNSTFGTCDCERGYKGPQCSIPICEPGTYGEPCDSNCTCDESHSDGCHPYTGRCNCKPGWYGDTCNESCPEDYYGRRCEFKCRCQNGATCSTTDGKCTCTPGWIGRFCKKPCPDGFYGRDCSLQCQCSPNATCDKETGDCYCSPVGQKNPECTEVCSAGKNGPVCKIVCKCPNDTNPCSETDDDCAGIHLEPGGGFFEENTFRTLDDSLLNETTFSDTVTEDRSVPTTGTSSPSTAGPVEADADNEIPGSSRHSVGRQRNSNSNSSHESNELLCLGTALAIGIGAFLIVGVVMLVIYFKRKRVPPDDIYKTYYSKSPKGMPDQQQFDNPVYAISGTVCEALNNTLRIKNTLSEKTNNLDRVEEESEAQGARASSEHPYDRPIKKNQQADSTNPTIDGNSVNKRNSEPVYDEIPAIKDKDMPLDDSLC